ncbi:Transcription_elongation factor SII [Hexamita inflata]|uniref:Transcription_elongation factor SII n=1 Tax=Hexamita inflata TaxID=28002 RepID=A0ABP1H522_9EUKA
MSYQEFVEELIQNPDRVTELQTYDRYELCFTAQEKKEERKFAPFRETTRKRLEKALSEYPPFDASILTVVKQTVNDLKQYLDTHISSEQDKVELEAYQNAIIENDTVYLRPISAKTLADRLETTIFLTKQPQFVSDSISQEYFDTAILYLSAFTMNKKLVQELQFNHPPVELLAQFQIVELETEDLKKKRWAAQESILAAKDLARYVVETSIECKKCHRKTVTMVEKQSRSADEATTLYYTCSACGYKWSIN